MNDYVTGGYSALAVILGLYVVRLRRRARLLARALPPRALPPVAEQPQP
jgi:hypothetical protein